MGSIQTIMMNFKVLFSVLFLAIAIANALRSNKKIAGENQGEKFMTREQYYRMKAEGRHALSEEFYHWNERNLQGSYVKNKLKSKLLSKKANQGAKGDRNLTDIVEESIIEGNARYLQYNDTNIFGNST